MKHFGEDHLYEQNVVVDQKLTSAELSISSPTVPTTASDTGSAGDIAWDSNYLYICVATDTWKRVALTSW